MNTETRSGPRRSARARLAGTFLLLFLVFGVGLQALSITLLDSQLPGKIQPGEGAAGASSAEAITAGPQTAAPSPTAPIEDTPIDPANPTDPSGSDEHRTRISGEGNVAEAIASYRTDALLTLVRTSSIALLCTGVLAGGATWWVARRALRPLQCMSATAKRISEHNLDERLPVSGPADELRDLGETVNATFDRLAATIARERSLIANTSHELRTPVANQRIMLEVTLANAAATTKTFRDVCASLLAQTHRHEAIIESMLSLAGSQHTPLECSPVRLDGVINQALKDNPAESLEVRVSVPAVTIEADAGLCERAITNLITNAIRHNTANGRIEITLHPWPEGPQLIISNTTAPLDETRLEQLREPFRRGNTDRTSTQAGNGLGLGLAIVEAICQRHGWRLDLHTPTPGIFTATLHIPAARAYERFSRPTP